MPDKNRKLIEDFKALGAPAAAPQPRPSRVSQFEKDYREMLANQQAAREQFTSDLVSPSRIANAAVPGAVGALTGYGSQILGAPGDIVGLYEEFKPESWASAPTSLQSLPSTEQVQQLFAPAPDGFIGRRRPEYEAGITGGNLYALGEGVAALPGLARGVGRGAKALGKEAARRIDEAMLTGEGALGKALAPSRPAFVDVWHGTPHRFPPTAKNPLGEFDPTKIGTGEGAQAYGYGHYVAEAPEVAKMYQRATSKDKFLTSNGSFDPSSLEHLNVRAEVRKGDLDKAIEVAKKHARPDHDYPETAAKAMRDLQQLEKLKKSGGIRPNEGVFYKVDLPDESVARMLDWDKPFSQQNPEVKKMLQDAAILGKDDWLISGMRGREIYNRSKFGAPVKLPLRQVDDAIYASDRLRQAGIPGIQYLDAGSRGAGTGTRNFVVFPGNEELLAIKERMKQGGTVSRDAMQMAAWNQQVQHKGMGGWMKGAGRTAEEAKRLFEIAKGTRSKAAQVEAGLYHPIGGGVKLSKPIDLMEFETVKDPTVKGVKRKIVTLQDLQGGIAIPLVGDRAAGGKLLTSVEGTQFRNPLALEAGPDYMLTHTIPGSPESSIWRSGKGVISGLQKQVEFARDMGRPIYGVNVVGAPTNVNFNTMVTEAILNQYDPTALTKKAKQAFLKDIRNYVPDPKKPHLKPGAVLTEADLNDVEALRAKMLAEGAGPLRKAFVERMGQTHFQEDGFPDVPAARLATTEPALVEVPTGSAGFTIGEIDPAARALAQTPRGHKTYPVALAGEYFGSLDRPIDYRDIFQEFADKRRLFGKPEGADWRSFDLSPQFQTLDQEWLDRVMRSAGAEKPREWKQGGPVHKAEGGMSSDDLIIEERPL